MSKRRAPNNHEDAAQKFFTILNTRSISSKSMKSQFGNTESTILKKHYMESWNFETSKPINRETKKPKNKHANKPFLCPSKGLPLLRNMLTPTPAPAPLLRGTRDPGESQEAQREKAPRKRSASSF